MQCVTARRGCYRPLLQASPTTSSAAAWKKKREGVLRALVPAPLPCAACISLRRIPAVLLYFASPALGLHISAPAPPPAREALTRNAAGPRLLAAQLIRLPLPATTARRQDCLPKSRPAIGAPFLRTFYSSTKIEPTLLVPADRFPCTYLL